MPVLPTKKRWIFAFVLVISGFFLFYRGGRPPAPVGEERSGNYTTTAKMTYRNLALAATISRESPQSCALTFTSPESLKDMSMVFWNDRVALSYKNASFSFDPKSVPGNAAAQLAVCAMNAAMRGEGVVVDCTDQVITVSGRLDSGEFILQLDRAAGNFLKLSIPAQKLEMEFTDFSFLE